MARIVTTPLQRFVLISLSIIVAVVVIAVSVYFANANGKPRPGDISSVTEQPSTGNPGVLNTTSVNIVPGYAFNVNDNLAVCNRKAVRVALNYNITDYSSAINKAVADISRDGGGSVMLDEGIYYVSTPIFPQNNTCIRGAGMLKTLLRMRANSPPFFRAGMVRIKNASRISIHDLTLDGSRANQNNSTVAFRYGRYGLYATEFKYLWLRGVRAVNHRQYGFDPHGTRSTWSQYLVIESCDASENGLDGFTIDQTEHVSLLKSTARHNYRHGVNIVTGSRDVLVRDVTADFNGVSFPDARGCGFIAQNNVPELQTRDIQVVNSTFTESPRGAVCISDSVNVSLSNVNATITQFLTTPCFVLRQARQVTFNNTRCTARSGRRVSNIESMFLDDMQGQAKHWRPTNPLQFSNQHTLNTWIPKTDPVCSYGISHKNICCPYDCDVCGKTGCGVYGQADRCCMDKILKAKKYCSKTTAPCIVKAKYLPLPDVFIDIPYAMSPGKTVNPKEPLSPQEIKESKNASALPPGGMAEPISDAGSKRANDTLVVALPGDKKKGKNRTIVINLPPPAMNVSEGLKETKKDGAKSNYTFMDLSNSTSDTPLIDMAIEEVAKREAAKNASSKDALAATKNQAGKKSNDTTVFINLPDDGKKNASETNKTSIKDVPRKAAKKESNVTTVVIDVPGMKEAKKTNKTSVKDADPKEDAKKESNVTTVVILPDGMKEGKKTNKTSVKDAAPKEDAKKVSNVTTVVIELSDGKQSNKTSKTSVKKDVKMNNATKSSRKLPSTPRKVPSATDPVCDFGISYKNVCCPYECNVCGKKDCGKNGQGHYCCMDAIVEKKKSCSKSSAPCVVDKKYLPLPKGKNSTHEKIFEEYMKKPVEEIIVKPSGYDEIIDKNKKEKADPLCTGGISFKNVCCAKDCKVCGEKGCGKDGMGGRCCMEGIMNTMKSCAEFSAPCIFETQKEKEDKNKKEDIKSRGLIVSDGKNATNTNTTKSAVSNKNMPSSDPTCKWGTKTKNVCCPYDCGNLCGKVGCGVDGQAGRCCLDSIIEADKSCDGNVAPCVIGSNSTSTSPTATSATTITITKSSGDPVCDKGIVYKNVCCPKDCEVCSKAGCGVDGLAGRCCMDSIVKADKSCNANSSPCVLDKKYLPLPKGMKNSTLFKESATSNSKKNSTNAANATATVAVSKNATSSVDMKDTSTSSSTANKTAAVKGKTTNNADKLVEVLVKEVSKTEEKSPSGRSLEFGVDSDGKMSGGNDIDMEGKEVYVEE